MIAAAWKAILEMEFNVFVFELLNASEFTQTIHFPCDLKEILLTLIF